MMKAEEARQKSVDEFNEKHLKKGGFQKMLDEQLAKAEAMRVKN